MKKHILFLIFLLPASVLSAQQRIYVHPAATGAADGTSWADAFTDLQPALQAAAYGDTMWVAEGTYLPTADGNRDSSFNVPNGLRMYGGFSGTETDLAQRDWAAHPVILSGNIGNPNDTTDNSLNIMFLAYPDSFTIVDGFTFRFGYAESVPLSFETGYEPSINGAAMYIDGFEGAAYPDIRNCTFEYNYAWGSGGAVYVYGGGEDASVAPRFLNCTFRHNRALNYGGALYRYGGSWAERYPDFGDCLFEKNFAGQWGGGLGYFDTERTDTLHFSGCRFVENEGEQDAGAMALNIGRIAGAAMIIRECAFDKNTTKFGGIAGIRTNGIPLALNTFIVSNTTFTNQNKLTIQILGGRDEAYSLQSLDHCAFDNVKEGFIMESQTVILINNIINSCDHFQLGAYGINAPQEYRIIRNNVVKNSNFHFYISVRNAPLDISNNMFINNTSDLTAGFFLFSSSPQLPPAVIRNSTFINTGGIIQNFQPSTGNSYDVTYQNCLFYGIKIDTLLLPPFPQYENHIAFNHCYFDAFGCTDQLYYTTCDAGTIIGGDPGFVDTASGDYRLSACSMLRDAGSNLGISGVSTDLDGNPRVQDGTVDIGVYEVPGFALASPSTAAPICTDTTSGSIALQASNGCEPYTVTWQNGSQSGSGPTGLSAGTYFLNITDQAGRLLHDTVSVVQGGVPQVSRDITPVVCGDTLGGSVTLSAAAGLSPYTFLWQDGQQSAMRTGLTTGVYKATVSDAAGCTAVTEVVMGSVGALDLDAQVGEISCYGAMDGTLSVMPLDGRPPYGYSWSEGPHSPHLNGLGPGLYYATVTDALGCNAVYLFNLSQPPLLTALVDSTAAGGPTQADGSLTAQAAGGTAPYQYAWSNNDQTPVADMLLPGPYQLTVTDQRGCTFTGTYSVPYTIASQEAGNIRPAAFLYPNPAQSGTTVYLHDWPAGTVAIDCRDAAGRRVLLQQAETPGGTVAAGIDTAAWPSGTYRVVLTSEHSLRPVVLTLVVKR
ncbi:MAG TPA: choice-of-anchor Q domain-containing protein [Saprospiraceae bacterium]|nr:choice-of-anchor Q domain-containing protein [Saprospiraceae bacterium]